MKTTRRIIAATDGSEPASQAVNRARKLASRDGSELEIYQSEKRDTADDILQRAAAIDAELIVVGAAGAGGATRLLSTSVTAKVLRTSRLPVLIVRAPSDQAYRNAIVLVDFTPASIAAVTAAKRVLADGRLILMHALGLTRNPSDPASGYADPVLERHHAQLQVNARDRLDNFAQSCGLAAASYDCIVSNDAVIKAIETLTQSSEIDLVVTGKHGRGRLVELILGSITREVLSLTRTDVLVVTDEHTDT